MKFSCVKNAVTKGKEAAEVLAADYREGKVTGRELALSGAVLFLAGLVLGMLFSPRKTTMVGCNNTSTAEFGVEEEEE